MGMAAPYGGPAAGVACPPVTEILDDTGLDPAVPAEPPVEPRRWWGRPLAEVRWQAELARLLVDPVFRGDGRAARRRDAGAPDARASWPATSSLGVMPAGSSAWATTPHGSGMIFNVDCSNRALERLDARLADIHERTGRPVALIGHSRGAHFAKALAHRRPERVAGVISLGAGLDTPFDISLPTKAAVAAARAAQAAAAQGRAASPSAAAAASRATTPARSRTTSR